VVSVVNKSLKMWLGTVAVMWLATTASARDWASLFVFGDSYSDSGAGYVDGNGPTAVYLADSLGIAFTYAGAPSSSGKSLNFAVSGATTGKGEGVLMRPASAACGINEGLLGRGMETQVLDFERQVNSGSIKFNPETALFFLAGGINDGAFTTRATVANLEGEVRALYHLGGRYFLVALIPEQISEIRSVGIRLNPALRKIPEELRPVLPGAHIEISRWGQYYDQVLQKPARYGIKDITDRCAGRALFGEDPTPCATPDSYFYYHDGHPSTAVHKIVGLELKREVAIKFR
jgi:phospholipase/lecithinase/hemolysin